MRRENFNPSKHARICSDHFSEKYMYRLGENVSLKENAIPTRFKAFPNYLNKVRNLNLSKLHTLPIVIVD